MLWPLSWSSSSKYPGKHCCRTTYPCSICSLTICTTNFLMSTVKVIMMVVIPTLLPLVISSTRHIEYFHRIWVVRTVGLDLMKDSKLHLIQSNSITAWGESEEENPFSMSESPNGYLIGTSLGYWKALNMYNFVRSKEKIQRYLADPVKHSQFCRQKTCILRILK